MSDRDTVRHFDNNANEYERRWSGYLRNTHDKMVATLQSELKEDDLILDASGGTGLLAARLLDLDLPFREYVLNDISPRMLSVAQKRLPEDPRLSFTSQSCEDLQFGRNRFTKVICMNALHSYEHPSVAVGQFKDILTPDGTLYLLDWNRSGFFRLINWFIDQTGDEVINTLSLQEVTRMLREHGYRILQESDWHYKYWHLYQVRAGFQHWKDR